MRRLKENVAQNYDKMRIVNEIIDFPKQQKRIVTIGAFDGVHKGHVHLLNTLVEKAKVLLAESVVLTFAPHPKQVLFPEKEFFVINTQEQKRKHFEKIGIDVLLEVPFTLALSELNAEQFFTEVIVKKLGATYIVVGPNHAIGKNRDGNHNAIETIAQKMGVELIDIPELMHNDISVRSTKIRQLLQSGQKEEAEKLLGYRLQDI